MPEGSRLVAWAQQLIDIRPAEDHQEHVVPRNRTPLREQYFRIGTLALGPVGAVAVLVTFLPFNHGGSVFPVYLLVGLVIVVFVGLVVVLLLRRVVGDRVEIAYREDDGKWRHGRVDVGHHSLNLQPCWRQTRFPAGKQITLQVEELGEDSGRQPSPRQWVSLNPQLHFAELVTDRGRYEIAALPSHLDELRERLTAEDAHQPPVLE